MADYMYRNLEKGQEVIINGKLDSNMNIRVEEIKIVKFKMRKYRNI